MVNSRLTGLAAVAALATGLAATSAGAVTVVSDGDSVNIGPGLETTFIGDVKDASGGAGMFEVTFNSSTAAGAEARVSILEGVASTFEDLTMAWVGEDGTEISSASVAPVVTSLSTMFMDPDSLSQSLVFSWTDSLVNVGFDFEVEVSPIPVPAAGLLLLTGIAGLGAIRSRRKAAAAV